MREVNFNEAFLLMMNEGKIVEDYYGNQYKYNKDLEHFQIYLNSPMSNISYTKEVSFTEMPKVFFIKEEEEKNCQNI